MTTTAIFLWSGFTAHYLLEEEDFVRYGGVVGAASAIAQWADRIDACTPIFAGLD